MTDIPELARRAQAWYATLTPAEREAHDKAQRESWVRGNVEMDRIDAAEQRTGQSARPPAAEAVADQIDQAYHCGRLAGLEEAAKVADEHVRRCEEQRDLYIRIAAEPGATIEAATAIEGKSIARAIRGLIK